MCVCTMQMLFLLEMVIVLMMMTPMVVMTMVVMMKMAGNERSKTIGDILLRDLGAAFKAGIKSQF